MAALACLASSLSDWVRFGLLVSVAVSLWLSLRHERTSPAIESLHVDSGGQWTVAYHASAESTAIRLLGSTLSSPQLVVLMWKAGGRSGSLLVLPDQLADDQFLSLRVALRIADIG